MPKPTLGVLLLLLGCVSAFSQQPPRNPAGQAAAELNPAGALRQIIPGHYVYSSTTYNSGIIVTSDGVIVLDALNSEAVARAQREAIASTIRQPVRILVSSTFHNNYSKGNVAYADVVKIGHENYRTDLLELMQREKVPAEEQKARLPNQTFRDRMTLYLGGKEIQILYMGRAHTRGDSIIFVPQDRIAYLSELHFADQFLFINDGYGVDWLRALDAAKRSEPTFSCRDMDRFRQTLEKPDKGSAASGRCWWMCATPFRRRLRAAQRRIRRLLPSNGLSMKNCRGTPRNGKRPCGGCISN